MLKFLLRSLCLGAQERTEEKRKLGSLLCLGVENENKVHSYLALLLESFFSARDKKYWGKMCIMEVS